MEWKEQYKHPKWQKRRLEKMESVMKEESEKDPLCEWCHDGESQLHVHHIRYVKNRKIWEYSDNELLLLCETCHKNSHAIQDNIKNLIFEASKFYEDLIEMEKVLYLMNRIPFYKSCYLPDIICAILKMHGKHKIVEDYKKQFENG